MTAGAGTGGHPPRSWIVAVGDELLLGRTVDTNGSWMGERLAELGLPCDGRSVVGDVDADIAGAVRMALGRADAVIVCGGLGPTEDDRTRAAVSGALGLELAPHPAVLEALRRRYAHDGGDIPPANQAVALVPTGALPLLNPAGTAPAIMISLPASSPDAGGSGAEQLVILLPGVPREMRALWPQVAEQLAKALAGALAPVHTRTLHTSGIAESRLAPEVERVLAGLAARPGSHDSSAATVSVAYLPDLTGVDLRLTTAHPDPEAAARALDEVEGALNDVIAPYRIPTGADDMAVAVLRLLQDRGWTLGLGESCTGGLIARRLTDHAGASASIHGGVVAYANEAKTALLGVPASTIAEHGAVSEPVARSMAQGAARALDAHCGVGVTGIAGPGGGTEEKPVGTVYIGVTVGERTGTWHHVFKGNRDAVRVRAAQAALRHLARMIQEAG